MTQDKPSLLETVVEVLVAAAVGVQAWVVINDATEGEAKRQVLAWWARTARPAVVRLVTWLDARAITEKMVIREIEPLLEDT